ncbi:hypothetical protein OHC33_006588 [Knufia fluminis]|uniref:Uncharacterized protein n=1 Tax=Knufia fluminis TaxID=191047 RepID=A0AAN8EUR0_9EURO|nr:hypothetical protein OHC33_006588 [Knufia fluminis]
MPRKSKRKTVFQKLDIGLDLTSPTEAKGIDKVPNEVLVKILTFVPYIQQDLTTPTHTSHHLLDQVDTRCQFPEVTSLNAKNDISQSRLDSYSKVHVEIQHAVELVAGQRGEKAKQVVTTGLHLLQYMTYIIGDTQWFSVNLFLMAWARKDLFSSRWLMILRYTIRCIFEYFYPSHFAIMDLLEIEDSWLAAEVPALAIRTLICKLCFESAVLKNNWRRPPHKTILDADLGDWVHDTLCRYRKIEFAIYADEIHTMAESDEEDKEDAIAFLKSKRWRMLSQQGPDNELHPDTMHDFVLLTDATERENQSYIEDVFNGRLPGTQVELTYAELNLGGRILRNMRNIIVEQGMPAPLESFIRKENLLEADVLESWGYPLS